MSGGGGSTQTVQTADPWSGQQPYLQDLFSQAQQFYQAPRPDLTGSSNYMAQGIEALGGYGAALPQQIGEIQAANRFLTSGDVLRPESNPALQQYINLSNQAIGKQFGETYMPAITGGEAVAGGIGSSRQGIAEALGSQNLAQALERNTAGLTMQGYGQGLDAYMRGLTLAPGITQMGAMPGQVFQQQAGMQRGLETQMSDQDLAFLNAYRNLISGQPGGTTTTTSPGMESGGFAGAIGGAAGGAALASAMSITGGMAAIPIGAMALLGYLS